MQRVWQLTERRVGFSPPEHDLPSLPLARASLPPLRGGGLKPTLHVLAIAVLGLLVWAALPAIVAAQLPPAQAAARKYALATGGLHHVKNLDEASRRGLLYVGLESGRMKVEVVRLPPTPTGQVNKPQDEQLTVRNSNGDFSIEYVKPSADRRLSIEIGVSCGRVHILQQAEVGADVTPVEFTQPPCGPLTLTVGAKQSQRTIHAASLWHLMIGYPEICRQNLLPLLQMIDSRWDPGKLAADLEEDLIGLANSQDAPDRRHWDALVAQLRDERYTRREAADRQLRAAGRIVIHYLRDLDAAHLDAEQKFRVRRIVAALDDSAGVDTPDRVTSWLAGDPAIWLGLLSRESESTRRLAFQQLSSLVDKPLVFDPSADEKTRQSQIGQIRAVVGD